MTNHLTSMAEQFVTLKGGDKLAYYDSAVTYGGSDKPVLVLLHGYCGSSAYFSRLAPLLQQQYRVLIPDLSGHGKSTASNQETYDMDIAAGWILDWLTQLSITKVHIFGHSLGGYITLALVAQQPALLVSFGLLHSTALPDSEQAMQNREAAIVKVQQEGVPAFVQGLVVKLFADLEASKLDVDYITHIGNETQPKAVIGFAKGMKGRVDHSDVIQQASIPVLLIAGAKDTIIKPEGTFIGSNDTTVCHTIEQAGHMGMLETPQEMAQLLLSFIGSVLKPPR